MTVNCVCGASLKYAQYFKDKFGNEHKTCPKCSQNAGHHVFYPIETFHERDMGDGRVIVQSHCSSCRSYLPPKEIPSFECS